MSKSKAQNNTKAQNTNVKILDLIFVILILDLFWILNLVI